MTMQSNGEIAARFLVNAIAGSPELDLAAADGKWWLPGGAPEMPLRPFLEGLPKLFPNCGKLEVLAITEQGDRVALEARSAIELGDGRLYSNEYHFLVVFRDGKVTLVKEYCDTARAREFFAS